MASPFAVFRRNQKAMLVVTGLLAMIAFVFLDPVMRIMGRSSRNENPVVVETKYGQLTQSELEAIRSSSELVNYFLQRISVETVSAQVKQGLRDGRNLEADAEQWYGFWRAQILDRSGEVGTEKAALETVVMSKKAEQLGLVISDQTINDTLKQVTGGMLGPETVQAVLNSLQAGRRVSAARLFDAMRPELLASKFSQLFMQSLQDLPPAERFEYYSRLNRRAKAEVMPLAVAEFIGQVADPPAEKLQAFFNEHKDRFPDPASPDPGFKEPKRAAFQYFKADIAKFTDEFKPQVTEAEIQDYYDKNKAQFRAIELPSDTPDAKPAEGETPEEKPAETPSTEATPDKPAAESPADNKPAEEKPAENKPAEENKQSATLNTSAVRLAVASDTTRATVRLVSANADDAQAPEAKAPAATETPAPSDAPATGESKPDESKPADATAEENPAEPADGDKPAEGKSEAAAAPEPKYEPLEKVQDKIRDSVAGEKARNRVKEIFEELYSQMRRYSDDIDAYNSSKDKDGRAKGPAPKPFPFAELAKAKGLEARELPLVTAAEAAKEDIGSVFRVVPDRRSQFGFRVEKFADFAFADALPTYQPMVVQDSEGNGYLFWKNEEKAAYVPSLDQIRDNVVRAWKMIEARELAKKRAEEYAKNVRAANRTLQEFYGTQPNRKIVTTDWFSWLTIGNVPLDPMSTQPRISQIEGLDNVGESFMEEVFKLSPAQTGVAMNHPQDTAYVIRLMEYERPMDELRQDFAAERQMRYMLVARPEREQMYKDWVADLNRDAKVHWLRQADLARARSRGEQPQMPDEEL